MKAYIEVRQQLNLPYSNQVAPKFASELLKYYHYLLMGIGHTGSNRVLRGGSWNNDASNCRVANRNNNHPDNRNHNYGFRLSNTVFVRTIAFTDAAAVLRTVPS